MNLQFFIEKLESSEEFSNFMKYNPGAYLCSGFFSIDFENNQNQYHLDYFVPSKNKIISFELENGIKETNVIKTDSGVPPKLASTSTLEFKDIEDMILKEMEKKQIKNKLQKIMISLQNYEGKDSHVCTCFLSGFGLLKVVIDDSTKEIVLFDKKSFFDLLRKV